MDPLHLDELEDATPKLQASKRIRLINCCISRVLTKLSFCFSVFLITYVARKHQLMNDHGKFCLDTWGVGAVTWGLLGLFATILFIIAGPRALSGRAQEPNKKQEEVFKDIEEATAQHDLLKRVFEGRGGGRNSLRALQFLFLLLRIVITTLFAWFNFETLPIRNPEKGSNLSKHVVTWIEVPIFALLYLGWMLTVFAPRHRLYWVSFYMREIAGFSTMQLVRIANPTALLPLFPAVHYRLGAIGVILLVIVTVGSSLFALIAFLMKFAQISFINERPYTDFSATDWCRLCAFGVNLASVMPSLRVSRIEGTLSFVSNGNRMLSSRWLSDLGDKLEATFKGFNALVIYSSLESDEVHELLKIIFTNLHKKDTPTERKVYEDKDYLLEALFTVNHCDKKIQQQQTL